MFVTISKSNHLQLLPLFYIIHCFYIRSEGEREKRENTETSEGDNLIIRREEVNDKLIKNT